MINYVPQKIIFQAKQKYDPNWKSLENSGYTEKIVFISKKNIS